MKSITSVTFILVGNMLTTFNSIGRGWTTTIIAIFGLILFFVGLNRLKLFLDDIGQKGVSKLVWAAILGIIAALFSFIPLVGGIPAGIITLIAFILQLVGLLKLKNSETLGVTGTSGINYLLVAMVLMILASLLGLFPLVGGLIKSAISLIAFMLIPFGWLKVQEAVIGNDPSIKRSDKVITSDSPLLASIPQQQINTPLSQPALNPVATTSNFDFSRWLNKNKNTLAYGFGLAVGLFAVYYFFLRHDPIKDAKKIASAFCNCGKINETQTTESYKKFISDIDSYIYSGREQAQKSLDSLNQVNNNIYQECYNAAQEKLSKIKGRYIGNKEKTQKFEYTYNAQQLLCSDNNDEISPLYDQILNKVNLYVGPVEKEQARQDSLLIIRQQLAFSSAAKSPPSIEKMKQDLLGKNVNLPANSQFTTWLFGKMEDIKETKIIETSFQNDTYSYTAKTEMKLHDRNLKMNFTLSGLISYILDSNSKGWVFQDIVVQEFHKIE